MRKKGIGLLLALALFSGCLLPARAETFYGDKDWHVDFTAEEEMESNFKTSDLDEVVSGLQPGDNILITLALENSHKETTDWYMTNKVLYSLEDRSANSATGGGAYTYRLTYQDKAGTETVLFDSETVGGDTVSAAGEGLHAATDALKDYFYLDTLESGQKGTITLEVALDGETQGNDYQDTLADLQMNFAVELREDTPAEPQTPGTPRKETGKSGLIKTGDESQPVFLAVLMTGSGLLLLLFCVFQWKEGRRRKKEEG
ncbi:MAG: sortase B protein-sorting domain-containing protein [Lachnospiraceae bacterium]|nr:sortase B protein-sorting domain-containing protein [Lachnospiraceae bacterium]